MLTSDKFVRRAIIVKVPQTINHGCCYAENVDAFALLSLQRGQTKIRKPLQHIKCSWMASPAHLQGPERVSQIVVGAAEEGHGRYHTDALSSSSCHRTDATARTGSSASVPIIIYLC
eukprot:3350087-Pleurochrysis_carterae.AAC.1